MYAILSKVDVFSFWACTARIRLGFQFISDVILRLNSESLDSGYSHCRVLAKRLSTAADFDSFQNEAAWKCMDALGNTFQLKLLIQLCLGRLRVLNMFRFTLVRSISYPPTSSRERNRVWILDVTNGAPTSVCAWFVAQFSSGEFRTRPPQPRKSRT